MDQQVSVGSLSDDTYEYTFETPIETADLEWLKSDRIKTYSVKGNVLRVIKARSEDWQSLNNDFIVPGLKRTFGATLKVNMPASTRR